MAKVASASSLVSSFRLGLSKRSYKEQNYHLRLYEPFYILPKFSFKHNFETKLWSEKNYEQPFLSKTTWVPTVLKLVWIIKVSFSSHTKAKVYPLWHSGVTRAQPCFEVSSITGDKSTDAPAMTALHLAESSDTNNHFSGKQKYAASLKETLRSCYNQHTEITLRSSMSW